MEINNNSTNSDIKKYLDKNLNKDVYYHSTFDNFEIFDFSKSPFGIHFGTKKSALNRVDVKILEDERLGGYGLKDKKDNPILIEAEIILKNPLELNENRTGQWTPFDVLREVMDKAESVGVDGITDLEIDAYYKDALCHNNVQMVDLNMENYGGEEYNTELKEQYFIRDWLESKGYDGIVYENEFESGGKSIIAFRNEQISIKNKEFVKPKYKQSNKKSLKNL